MKKQTKICIILFALILIAILRFFIIIGTDIIKIPLTILIMSSLILLGIILKSKKLNKKMNKSISLYFWSVLITIVISIFTLVNYSLNPPSPGYISQITQDIIFIFGSVFSGIMFIIGAILDKSLKRKK